MRFLSGVEREYYQWLLSLVDVDDMARYHYLMLYLFDTEFYSKIEKDDNRAEDGKDLRRYFSAATGKELCFFNRPCSVLEMLIALSRRYHGEVGDSNSSDVPRIFWEMLGRLGLWSMDNTHFDIIKVSHILKNLLDRTYDFDGKGGLFPLKACKTDQREVEIWYQLQAFLIENR